MGRSRSLTEMEIEYVRLRGEGKNPTDAARGAGYGPGQVKNAYRIESRYVVGHSVEAQRRKVQLYLLLDQCDLGLVSQSMKRSLREGNPATQRLFFEVHGMLGNDRLREYSDRIQERFHEAVGRVATLLVRYVAPENRPAFERDVALLRAQRVIETDETAGTVNEIDDSQS